MKVETTLEHKMLTKFLKKFDVLTNEEIENFVQITTFKYLYKGEFLIKEGENCKEVAFLLGGTFRSFYISEKGDEITYCITFPNNFITAYSSFITGTVSSENIQAITNAELLVIPKKQIENLAQKNPNWVQFLKIMAEYQYLELEKRVFQLQRDNAVKKYSELIKNQPQYIQKIPLQYLSSYLGITQRHLSRIRKTFVFRQMS